MTILKPKILHVVYSLGVGGAEIYLSTMSKAASQRGLFENEVLGWRKSGPLSEQLSASGIHVHPPLKRSKRPLFLQLTKLADQIADIAKQSGATHIHGHLNDGALLAVMAARRAKLISIAHVHSNHILPVSLGRVQKQIWERAAKWTYNNADRVLSISEEVETAVRARFSVPQERLRRAPIGIAAPVPEKSRAEVRAELGLQSTSKALIFVGRLVSNKNQKALVNMMPAILAQHPDTKLLLVGDGPDEADLASLVEDLNLSQSVNLLGRRFDVPDLLSASDAFVTASETEGVSLAVLEAFALGLPVMAARAPGNTELVGSGRGWLAPSADPQDLANTMMAALTARDTTRSQAVAAQAYWGANHSLESAVGALASIYAEPV